MVIAYFKLIFQYFPKETVENNENRPTDSLQTKHDCHAFSVNKLCIVEVGKPKQTPVDTPYAEMNAIDACCTGTWLFMIAKFCVMELIIILCSVVFLVIR
jgi:hypothetical protein